MSVPAPRCPPGCSSLAPPCPYSNNGPLHAAGARPRGHVKEAAPSPRALAPLPCPPPHPTPPQEPPRGVSGEPRRDQGQAPVLQGVRVPACVCARARECVCVCVCTHAPSPTFTAALQTSGAGRGLGGRSHIGVLAPHPRPSGSLFSEPRAAWAVGTQPESPWVGGGEAMRPCQPLASCPMLLSPVGISGAV